MPRKLAAKMSYEEFDREVDFTRAALEADPNAVQLLELTESWDGMVQDTRKLDRAVRTGVQRAYAARVVANTNLDRTSKEFGEELWRAVKKDRDSGRWKQYFGTLNLTRYLAQPFRSQVDRTKVWFTGAADKVFEKHRTAIEPWIKAAQGAIDQTAALAQRRGEALIAKEILASDLTRERDGLHVELRRVEIDQDQPRGWADQFFIREERESRSESAAPETENPSEPAGSAH